MKVLVGMSGGVDSSVAAALLMQQGHDVTGVHLKLAPEAPARDGRARGCCSVADADDARRVAEVLDIPFYVWNLSESFHDRVVEDFVGEYARGRTPNPCVRCNETIKFGEVLRRGIATGFDAVATGHYAVVTHEGRPRLYRSADPAKDQSYVLSTLGAEELSRALFPVGAGTKTRTREIASALALRTADKPESYDICFVPDGDAAGFVERAGGGRDPGPILDVAGHELGEHSGIHRFTVGQRRGLGLATHERHFVLDVDAPRNAIVVGPAELLARTRIQAERVSWLAGEPDDGASVEVQIRAHGRATPGVIERAANGAAAVRLSEPERGVSPGQVIAFYRGNEVLGGGTIAGSAA